MPQLTKLAKIAKKAGEKLLEMQPAVVEKEKAQLGSDKYPHSEADDAANKIVLEELNRFYPNIPIVSEENSVKDNNKGLKSKEYFAIDPLDNTRSFVEGKGAYSINIGKIENGLPTEGAIYFPKKRELYFTKNGRAFLQKDESEPKEIRVARLSPHGPIKVAVGFANSDDSLFGNITHETGKYPGQLRTCMVAAGECHVTGRQNEGFNIWDIAAPHAVLRAAGGEIVLAEDRKPFRYNGEIKVPAHFSGAIETLLIMGHTTKGLLQPKHQRQL
ncbi:MAG: 3'(2'),5'-bisphosphate nucleotidase CysQ [Rickettsiales bacterium]